MLGHMVEVLAFTHAALRIIGVVMSYHIRVDRWQLQALSALHVACPSPCGSGVNEGRGEVALGAMRQPSIRGSCEP